MRTYDLKDEQGRLFAFEVTNVGRRAACRIVESIPDLRVIRRPKPWRLSTDEQFCEFELHGVGFVIWEPFGDNSRYWVGPKSPEWVPEVGEVHGVFRRARSGFPAD